MNAQSTALFVKLAQNPIGSDNEWSVEYVNSITPVSDLWRALAARKPPECAEIIARFARFVQVSEGCWLWTGSRTGSWKGGQHGQFSLFHDDHIYAHRLSYLLFNGLIPDGCIVRHTCDVGYCVRPSHLLSGTQKDNCQDAVERGRLPKFRQHRKLSPEQVIDLRRDRMRGIPVQELATHYGVSKALVSMVCNLNRRQHLAPAGAVARAAVAS